MQAIKCEMCSSTDLVKKDGMYICQHCGTKYTVEEAKKLMSVVIDNTDRLNDLYKLARRAQSEGDSKNAADYYGQIVELSPDDWEAYFYKTLNQQKNVKIAQIRDAALTMARALPNVFKLISSSTEDKEWQTTTYTLVYTEVLKFGMMLMENIISNANGYSDPSKQMEFAFNHSSGVSQMYETLGDLMKKEGFNDNALSAYNAARGSVRDITVYNRLDSKIRELNPSYVPPKSKSGGCYVATCVYGSYDCPEVWTLRRYRDYDLMSTGYGRLFVKLYYAVSPTLVKILGDNRFFRSFWKERLDKMIHHLQLKGYKSTPYIDK